MLELAAFLTDGIKFKGVMPGLPDGARLRNLRYQGRMYSVDAAGIQEEG